MTKIKLTDGAIINAESVELVNGALEITIADGTVEELAAIFSDKAKTNLITLMTESGIESGRQIGFTSFAGIHYDESGMKTIQLFQPVDASEARIAAAEGTANQAIATAEAANARTTELEEQNVTLSETVDSILTDVIPSLM